MPRQCFAEECLGRGDTAIRTEQKVDRFAVLVDSPIEIIPLAPDLDVGFSDAPGSIHGSCEAAPSLLELREFLMATDLIRVTAPSYGLASRQTVLALRRRSLP